MYLLAHTGITLGAAYLIEQAYSLKNKERPAIADASSAAIYSDDSISHRTGASSSFKVDYRYILLGSLLPDIIDKPLGIILLPETLSNARTLCHTLLFLTLIAIIATTLYVAKKRWEGFFIVFGVLTHFLMDAMWLDPITLLWPFYAPAFQKYPGITLGPILKSWIDTFTIEPQLYISEIAGLIILVFFGVKALVQKKVKVIICTGHL